MKIFLKLFLVLFIGFIITIIMYIFFNQKEKIFMTIGDSLCEGITPSGLPGISYNDYLYEDLKKMDFVYMDSNFCKNHLYIKEFNEIFINNKIVDKNNRHIKQNIKNSTILSISFGMDELIDKSLYKEDTTFMDEFIMEYKKLLINLREFYDNEIIIVGVYSNYKLNNDLVVSINKKLRELAVTYKCIFIDITPIFQIKEYFPSSTSYHMNYLGNKYIYNLLKKELKI